MKILFINPPVCNLTGHSIANSPVLGVMYLAAVLEKNNYQAKIIDADAMHLSWDALMAKIISEKPDIIGLTSTTLGLPVMFETVNCCRKAAPQAKIVVGGIGPTLEPKRVISENKAIDIVCIGEGEDTVVELAKKLENNQSLRDVKGLAFYENGEYFQTEPRPLIKDLDSIPFPAYHLLEPSFSAYPGVHGGYEGINRPNAVMMGSRGCPHRCIFCCCNFQRSARFRSPKNIVDEIEFCHKVLGANSIHLYDNEFVGMTPQQNAWIEQICDELIKRGLDKLGYIVQGRCSRFISLETLKKMRQAGIRWVWWGVESGSQKILDRIKKDIKIDEIIRTFKLAKRAGLKSLMFIMIGFPDETNFDIKKSGRLIRKIKPDKLRVHIVTPLPGSELWDELNKNGQIWETDFLKYDTRLSVVHSTNTMSREEIKRVYQTFLFKYENGYWYFIKFFLKSLVTKEGLKQVPERIRKALKLFTSTWLKY